MPKSAMAIARIEEKREEEEEVVVTVDKYQILPVEEGRSEIETVSADSFTFESSHISSSNREDSYGASLEIVKFELDISGDDDGNLTAITVEYKTKHREEPLMKEINNGSLNSPEGVLSTRRRRKKAVPETALRPISALPMPSPNSLVREQGMDLLWQEYNDIFSISGDSPAMAISSPAHINRGRSSVECNRTGKALTELITEEVAEEGRREEREGYCRRRWGNGWGWDLKWRRRLCGFSHCFHGADSKSTYY